MIWEILFLLIRSKNPYDAQRILQYLTFGFSNNTYYLHTFIAYPSFIYRTKLGETPLYVRSWNGLTPSLVRKKIGFTTDLHRNHNRFNLIL
jgi:hypothetical protein